MNVTLWAKSLLSMVRGVHDAIRAPVAVARSATIGRCSAVGRSSSRAYSGSAWAWTSSWFIVLFLIIWSLSGYYEDLFPGEGGKAFVLAVVSALLFFLSILLHEFGHAWVAIRNGIGISGIDLWMFGGVAKLERDTDSAGLEFRVAVAGPAVTLLIAAACFGAGTALSGAGDAFARHRASRPAASARPPRCSPTSPRSTRSCCSST